MGTHHPEHPDVHTVERPRIDPTINYGHLLMTLTFLASCGALLWQTAAFKATTEARLAAMETGASTYRPRVDALVKSQDLQDERIGRLGSAIADVRTTNGEVLKQIGGVREDLAGIKARLPAAMILGPR